MHTAPFQELRLHPPDFAADRLTADRRIGLRQLHLCSGTQHLLGSRLCKAFDASRTQQRSACLTTHACIQMEHMHGPHPVPSPGHLDEVQCRIQAVAFVHQALQRGLASRLRHPVVLHLFEFPSADPDCLRITCKLEAPRSRLARLHWSEEKVTTIQRALA